MDYELQEHLKDCFMRTSTAAEAYEKASGILENNLKNIDFEDDDDLLKLFEVIQRALCYKDDDREFHGEVGIKFIELLASKGFDINFKLLKKECLILFLADYCWIEPEIFGKVVELGADVYSETSSGDNVLTRACKRNNEDSEAIALYIIENYGVSVFDHPDSYGYTPLMHAVSKGRPRIAEALIKHGADVNRSGGQSDRIWQKTNGVSPFALACRMGDYDTAKLLLENGADETACDAEGIPASFRLVYIPNKYDFNKLSYPQQEKIFDRKTQIVSLLKNLEATDSKGNTLLMQALVSTHCSSDEPHSPYNNRNIISALIERGANVNAVNNAGKRPIHFAAENYDRAYNELLDAGADINAQDNEGNTALIIECMQNGEKDARMLIRKGADFKIKNNKGKSAADLAAENGLMDILELMI